MKIIFYIGTLAKGGAERVISDLANEFVEKGNDVVFTVNYDVEGGYFLDKRITFVPLLNEKITNSITYNLKLTNKLKKLIEREVPDVLVSFMAEPNFRSIISCSLAKKGTKTILSVRLDPRKEYASILYRFLARILFPYSSGIVFQTEEAMNQFPSRIQRKSRIIKNPINAKFFSSKNTINAKGLIAVGRLTSQKNFRLLLDSFKQVNAVYPNETLSIFGTGELLDYLVHYVAEVGLTDRVLFMGEVNNIENFYKNYRIYILSSDYEGLPNSLMEAMASGLTVISTDCPVGGPRELINDGVNGLLVPVNSVDALSNAIISVLCNPEFANGLAKEAEIEMRKYRTDIIFSEWDGFVKKLTQSRNNVMR